MRTLLFCFTSLALVTFLACSGRNDETPPNSFTDPLADEPSRPRDAGGHDAGRGGDAGHDAGGHDSGSDGGAFTVAPHPPFPLLVRGGAGQGVIAKPVVVPIFFPGYDHTADVTTQLKDMGTVATYWRDAVSEYGVGLYTFGTPVHLTEQAPASIGGGGIDSWIAGKLDGTHPEFGTPTNSTIYVIYYPATTAVQGSCSDPATGGVGFGGYHTATQAKNGSSPAYAVIAECATFGSAITNSLDMVTVAGSHEIIEASTDTGNGFGSLDKNGFALDLFLQGNEENGDLCAVNHAFIRPGGGYPYLISRGWSNKAAGAGDGDPCQPGLPDQPFIGAAPVTTDTVSVPGAGRGPGILIPVGKSRTIDVELWSTGPTAPFTVAAKQHRGVSTLSFAFDKNTGVNGDRLKLTITVNTADPQGFEDFVVTADLNGEATPVWAGIVANR
jgi:hypothetical protein